MSRKQKKIHYLYKTTCKVTGRYYIGMHSTSNLEDGYLGSGKRLRYSIRKYGEDNHEKEIIEFFDSRELLVEAEKTAITPEMLDDLMCMNLKGGGYGGFISDEHQLKCSLAGAKVIGRVENSIKAKNEKMKNLSFYTLVSERIKNGLKKINFNHATLTGTKRDEITKKKIGATNAIKQKGDKNSQFGTCWIKKDGINKKIKRDLIDEWLKNGWVLGRILKKS